MTSWRSSFGRAFQRKDTWCVNDLSAIELRTNGGAYECDSSRGARASVRLDTQKIVEIGGLARLEYFVGDGENFVVNALINFEPI